MKRLFYSAIALFALVFAASSCKYFKVGESKTVEIMDTTATVLKAWDKAYPMGWMAEEDTPTIKYLFYDIDKDGKNELFISRGPWSMAVLTFEGDSLNCLSAKWHDRMDYEVAEGGYLLEFFEIYESQFNREQNWIFYRLEGCKVVDSGWYKETFSGKEEGDDLFDSVVELRIADSSAIAARPYDLKEADYRKVEREEYIKHTPGEEESAKQVLVTDLPGWKEVKVAE